ncbi:hypothetical protein M422DRAFT_29919 [Sphaerobolus stellatus SS14]|uniref:Proline dehydrogenase n=1 Tax=Sphaerobolus stellatus (strain SS14) TaxID=990650 RepID=A0A0C9UQ64_SPHS4|nr:hypothetical protein M422DRAFT_29919 [Sphaerobolus stellatus SS14]
MLSRLYTVARPRPSLLLHVRRAHSTPSYRPSTRVKPLRIGILASGFLGGAYYLNTTTIEADADLEEIASDPLRHSPFSTLLRSYTVYALCSIPFVVEYSPALLSKLITIPGISTITEAIVRSTFFPQFVGGESAEETLPLLSQMRRDHKGVLFAYSVEVDEAQVDGKAVEILDAGTEIHRLNVAETIKCIDVAGDFEDKVASQSGRKTWVAIKLTALLPSAQALVNFSHHLIQTRPKTSPSIRFPGCPHPSDLAFIESGAPAPSSLTPEEVADLKQLYEDLTRIVERGRQRGVQIIVDAEYSWYQPAIDAFTLSLTRRFNALPKNNSKSDSLNNVQPLIYATYQAYLRRTPEHLRQSFKDAQAGGYSLGIKLVRGAYHHFEVQADPSLEGCPVWMTKPETDECYDACAAVIISALQQDIQRKEKIPRVGVLFGTHNSNSCMKILDGLVKEGIANKEGKKVVISPAAAERCTIGQLYGMSDALTDKLVGQVVSPSPFVIKYVPYGPLVAVMPYLGRRAIENKSVLSGEGGAAAERKRVGAEIRRRLLFLA